MRCLIENPAFDSQTKENLTSKPSTFGSSVKLDEKFLKKRMTLDISPFLSLEAYSVIVAKSEIVENVLSFAQFKQGQALTKVSKGKRERVQVFFACCSHCCLPSYGSPATALCYVL